MPRTAVPTYPIDTEVWVPWGISGARPGVVRGYTQGGRLRIELTDYDQRRDSGFPLPQFCNRKPENVTPLSAPRLH